MRVLAGILIMWVAVLFPVHGENYNFTHLNSNNGLSHNQANSIVQDEEGYIWIGTRNGLAKYDGYSMEVYYHEQTDSCSLCNNFVQKLYTDSRGRLWALTPFGVCRYRPETDDFKCYNDFSYNIGTITETADRRILCGGDALLLYDEKKDTFSHVAFDPGYVVSMVTGSNGDVYLSNNSAIYRLDSSLTKYTQLTSSHYTDFITGIDGIIPLYIDSADNLWVGRNGKGAAKINLSDNTITVIGRETLPDNTVRVITEDSQRRIWIGTEKGVCVMKPDGTADVLQYDPYNTYSLSDNAIYSIFSDRSGNVWIGSYFGGVDVLPKPNSQFTWYRMGNKEGDLRGKAVRMIAEPSPQELWIATEDGGISIFDKEKNSFSFFDKIPEAGTNVHCLYYDERDGDIWIGTFRKGLFRYNLKTRRYKQYLMSHGLTSDAIFYIAVQRNGTMWVATTQGLRYYDRDNDEFCITGNDILDRYLLYSACRPRRQRVGGNHGERLLPHRLPNGFYHQVE